MKWVEIAPLRGSITRDTWCELRVEIWAPTLPKLGFDTPTIGLSCKGGLRLLIDPRAGDADGVGLGAIKAGPGRMGFLLAEVGKTLLGLVGRSH